MRNGAKRWGAAGAGLVLAGVVVGVALFERGRAPAPTGAARNEAADDVSARWRGFAAAMPDVGADPSLPSAPPSDGAADARRAEGNGWLAPQITREQLELAMDAWRQGIEHRNAEDVVALDRIFLLLPGRYGPELERLAQDDPNERVRAFSTRVLGKMKNAALAGFYRQRLADKSPYVRQNAAWALGELLSVPKGRPVVEGATGELRHAAQSDPSPEVREEAAKTLGKLQ
jgi:hypothetical protein